MAKKAISFMKEQGEGWVQVRRVKTVAGKMDKVVWTTRTMMVMDSYGEFNLPAGKYIFDNTTKMIVPHTNGRFPDMKSQIPKRKGYHKAQVETQYDMLKVLERAYSPSRLVVLKAKGLRVFLNYDYYGYLNERPTDIMWKIKDKESPVLFFQGKQLSALVMPIRIEE